MHILSVICLLLLIPYVVVALAFMPKGKGKQLFNMIYSSVALAGVGTLIFYFCRQYVTAYAGYPDVQAQRLDTMVCCLLLMIPVILLLIILNMVLKKPKGGLLFFIAMGLSVADGAGVCLYAFFSENIYATFLPMAVPAAVLLAPLLCALAAGGLLPFEGKFGRGVHWTIQTVLFLCVTGFILYGAWSLNSLLGGGWSELAGFSPIAVAALIIPGVPLVLFFRDMVKRSDRTPRPPRKKREKKKKAAV